MVLYHLRHAIRRLRREPGFTLAAALTLALGVGANVAVFSVVEAVLLRPLPYSDPGQLVILNNRDRRTGITKEHIAIGDYVDLASRQTSFGDFGAYGAQQVTIYGDGDPYQAAGLMATAGALSALEMRPVLGRSLTADDARPGAGAVMLLGYDLWRRRYGGDSAMVGRSIKVGDTQETVVGVAPPSFHFPPSSNTDVILAAQIPEQAPAARKSGWTLAVARLKPNRTVQDAAADLATISQQLETEYPQSNQASTYYPVPLRDQLVGGTKRALVLLLAAVAVVLLIACVNVSNLLVARSLGRRREMAVRMALGAGRLQLVGQLLTESLLLAAGAGVLGMIIAHWGARAVVALVPREVGVAGLSDLQVNAPVLLFTLALTILTGLTFGMMAAFTTKFDGVGTLVTAGRATMSTRARRLTSGLVAAEIAFAAVLLMGAGLILRSFADLLAVDPGFQSDHVMTIGIQVPGDRYASPQAREALYNRLFASLRGLPEVTDVGAAIVIPLTGNNWTAPFQRADQPVPPGERPPDVGWQLASGGFFRALKIPLLSGRLFDQTDHPGGPPVVIVSQSVERLYFGGGSAVGRQILLGQQKMEIVGVVGDIRRAALSDSPRADLYFPFESTLPTQQTLFIRTGSEPTRILAATRAALREIDPDLVLSNLRTMDDYARESVRLTEFLLWLLGGFAVTALLLAGVGVYGVMSYVVRQRTREIGTRMALGALRSDILWLVLRQGAMIAAIGTVTGLLIGLAATRTLGSILYGVSATDPPVLVLTALVLLGAGVGACYVPALRAASVDPARTLTEE